MPSFTPGQAFLFVGLLVVGCVWLGILINQLLTKASVSKKISSAYEDGKKDGINEKLASSGDLQTELQKMKDSLLNCANAYQGVVSVAERVLEVNLESNGVVLEGITTPSETAPKMIEFEEGNKEEIKKEEVEDQDINPSQNGTANTDKEFVIGTSN